MPRRSTKTKLCLSCNIRKPITQFAVTRKLDLYPDGRFSSCTACRRTQRLEQQQEQAVQAQETEDEQKLRLYKEKRALERKAAQEAARNEIKSEKRQTQASDPEKEYAARVLARRRLLAYIKKFMPTYQDGWVHRDICRRLEKFLDDVANEKSPRLVLTMPPRHGKSEIASKNFPSWALGKFPYMEIIACSYAVSLPLGFSRKVRDRIMGDKTYQSIFPETMVNSNAQSSEGWETTEGGGYVPAGVGGSITGKGAHILIIDDPVKDAAEADSDTIRESTWDWWGATAKTRLAPGGGVLVIQTRWHDDDLAGRMLQQQKDAKKEFAMELLDAEQRKTTATSLEARIAIEEEIRTLREEIEDIDDWELVNYPAIATHDEYLTHDGKILALDTGEVSEPNSVKLRAKGEALHPARFPLPRLRNMRKTMQPRHWSALYQQNPVPDEGSYFAKDMLRYRPVAPNYQGTLNYMAVDLAIGQKQVNDRTVIAIGSHHWDNTLTIPEMIGGRWPTFTICDNICNKIVQYDIQVCGIENGALKMSIWPVLQDMMRKRNITCAFDETLTPINDKSVRARPLQGMMQGGMVHFVRGDEWVDRAVHELLRFPGGVHDDYVDALAWLIRVILKQSPPDKPGPSVSHVSWRDKLAQYVEGASAGKDWMGA